MRAVRVYARSYRHVESILKAGLDRVAIVDEPESTTPRATDHANVRGRGY